ncbi:SDR family NAD(P)-dependent oxidoreductase [Aspergillus glaucus CBS 516.65]|uniref:Short chain dehydrogenase/reductase family n=1 Tax=Aspergillus glaucus CBS 516.65 TaxID=1160497 RepID=A0A1L9VB98_ASPGL|nr:hypothetical protein ASPGLDRAFT_177665 [Aspergillus glaucus CBS 516.65]OJJ81206.1 hypothetical protein ASPGLDRAFT_177665 [Aspergillus glaucus CBS 516.65]
MFVSRRLATSARLRQFAYQPRAIPIQTSSFSTSRCHNAISDSLRQKAQQNNQQFKLDNLFNVKDKVALISGGGTGIGLMATQTLAVNGAKVYITGRTEEKLNRVAELYGKEIPGSIIPVPADITSKESIQNLADAISQRESHLSILINNAGISSHTQTTEHDNANDLRKSLFDDPDATIKDWEDVYRTNVPQLFFMTTAFLPLLKNGSKTHHGWSSTVINISSISGIVKTAQHHFAYNASKAAAIHLTKMLANEISGSPESRLPIRINNIAPGVFPSEMTTGESDEMQKSYIPKEKYEKKTPARRPGKDEDMGSAVLFAATNQYLNGQTVVVDGGYVLAAGSV